MSKSISNSIRAEKEAQHVTSEQLAAVADMSISAVNKLLADETRAPSVYAVGRMCAYLHISLDEYFGIDVPSAHEVENAKLQAKIDAGDVRESFYASALARKDKIIRWLVAAVVVLASLSVGSYLVWDLTHADWGFFRG